MSAPRMIPQVDPKASYLAAKQEIDRAVQRVLDSGWYILGPEVEAFEKEFASYLGVDFGVGVGSGTDALELSLRALDIGTGDAVATVSNTAVATVAAVQRCGAEPVLVDIDPQTMTMDPQSLLRMLKSSSCRSIKAVIPVHLYGRPADMESILEIANRWDVAVVEDCAQAHGAEIQGKKVGGFGVCSAFSFYPTKNLGALGDGGFIATNDAALYQRLLLLRQYGWERKFVSKIEGVNSRLDEMQAAVLRIKLKHLDEENSKRQSIADYYLSINSKNIVNPEIRADVVHVFHQYVVQVKNRDHCMQYFKDNGIQTGIHYPVPIHKQPAYINSKHEGLKVVERVVEQIVSLPMHPYITEQDLKRIGKALKNY